MFRIASKILLGKIVWLSLRWLFRTASLWMWNLSSVFRWGPFLCFSRMSIVVSIVPTVCAYSLMCLAKFEEALFCLAAFLCSLNLVSNFLPVWPMYALLQSGHVSLYTPE